MKLRSPAAARNVGPIGDVLREWLPTSGTVLEVASGSGEHAVAFARLFPKLRWQPSDPDAAALTSIETWRAEEGTSNLLPPLALDVACPEWRVGQVDALVSINMVHISPWSASIGLLEGGGRHLRPGGALILYGPWIVEGEPVAPSNLAFDADLKGRDPAWGLREVGEFAEEARHHGFVLEQQCAMPANNLMLLFRRGLG